MRSVTEMIDTGTPSTVTVKKSSSSELDPCIDSPAAESDTTTVEPGSIPASITADSLLKPR